MKKKVFSFIFVLLLSLLIASPLHAKLTNFPDGISVYGVPVVGGSIITTGNIYFVDSGIGSDNYPGVEKDLPLATLDAAVGKCTANNGDYILVAAGHTENLAAADAVDVDVAGVTILGFGNGTDRPTFTHTGTGGEFVIGAANVRVEGLRFIPGISDVVMGISIEAAGDNCTIKNCEFVESTTHYEFLDVIDIASGADFVTIDEVLFHALDNNSVTNHFVEAGNGVNKDLIIRNCILEGYFAVSAIWSDTADLRVLIADNFIANYTSGQHCIEFTSTATGTVARNVLYTDAEATTLDPGSLSCIENYVTTTTDAAGVIIPKPDDTAQNFIGVDDNDNAVATSQVAANPDGSILERLEQIQEGVNQGTGQALPSNKSLFDIIGEAYTDDGGADHLDDVQSHLNLISTFIADGDGDCATGQALPANKSLFDIIGEVYTDDGGGDHLDDVYSHIELTKSYIAGLLGVAAGSIGNIFYVDSNAGSDSNNGTTWALAEATLDAAIGDCTANSGDVILIAPAHAETLGDAQITCDVAGITIIGLGEGAETPSFTFQHANSSIDITGASTTIRNIELLSDTAATAIGIDVDAADCVLDTINTGDSGNFEFAIVVDLGADAERPDIKNCQFVSTTGTTGATSAIAITGGVIDGLRVTDCRIWGDFSDAAIHSDQINTNAYIARNTITNNNSGNHAIQFSAATTGELVDNRLYSDAFATGLDPGSLKCMGNLFVDAVDESGYPIPVKGDSTDNYIGTNSGNNDATTASVAANTDGSILERLEQIQEVINPGTGTALDPNESVADVLYATKGIITFPAASQAANNVSMAEVLRYVQEDQLPRMESKAYADLTGYDTAACFTVTGDVLVRVVGVVGATAITCTSGTTTLSLGTTEDATSIIAATTIDNSDFDATDVWVDNDPQDDSHIMTQTAWVVVGGGADIILTRNVDDLTAGTLTLYCWWIPLSSDGDVTPT